MKTILTLFVVIACVTMSFANPLPPEKSLEEVTFVEAGDQRFNLIVKEAVGRVLVSIYNERGKMIDRVSFRALEAVSVPFNLSQVPEGQYRVCVQSKDQAYSFSVTSKKAFEKKPIAYAKAVDPTKISLTVVGIEQPGIWVTLYEGKTQRKINEDFVEQLAGFRRDYRLVDTTADEVYMEVRDVNGNAKIFYF